MSHTWFTADLHLGHAAILRHQPRRPWLTIEEHDGALLDILNKYVQREDTLYILGDWVWRAGKAGHYRQRINCRKIHLVQGNHDANSLRRHVSTMELMMFPKIDGQHFHLSHYPLASWRKKQHGGIHLYGHCHGTVEEEFNLLSPFRKSMDVGVDNAEYLTGEHDLENIFGEGSPLSKLYDLDGYILLIGVDHSANTSLHLAEYRADYPGKHEEEE